MTTKTRTSTDSRLTHRTSPTGSPERFVLTLWTADAGLAARADAAGIDRIGVDLETLGKAERQRGRGTWISSHEREDLAGLQKVVRSASLFARVNPMNAQSAGEVEDVLARGARVLMLPMVRSAEQADAFARLVARRASVVLLVETARALAAIGELAEVDGVDELHLGLNDLALDLKLTNRWLLLAGDQAVEAGARVHAAGRRFGLGGIGTVDQPGLPVPADLIYAQYARTGATAALVSRSFVSAAGGDLAAEVDRARARLAEWRTRSDKELLAAAAALEEHASVAREW